MQQTRINIARLMPTQPPQFIEPLRLARQGAHIHGSLPLAAMARLQQAVHEATGEAEFKLEFRREANGIQSIMGDFSVTVSMICQRCLQPMAVNVSGDIQLGIVRGGQEAEQLPPGYEPLQVDEGPLKLQDLIEDELLLALPIAPRHSQTQCLLSNMADAEAGQPASADRQRQYPFTELATLKRNKD